MGVEKKQIAKIYFFKKKKKKEKSFRYLEDSIK